MRLRGSREQSTSYWQNSSGNLLLSIYMLSSYLGIRLTNISILFDQYWRYYTLLVVQWTWRNAKDSQTASIILVMSFDWAPQIFDTNSCRHTWTRIPDNSDEARSFSELCKGFRSFFLNFALPAALLNKMLYKAQLQNYDGLTEDETIAFETLKEKLV